MKTKTYCLASPKGGSGKTVLCASFASFLSQLGKKVFIVDADIATHGLTLFYLNEVNDHKGLVLEVYGRPNGLFDGEPFSSDRDIVLLANKVALLPATFHFQIPQDLSENVLRSALTEVLEQVKGNYDYILLDAQAGSDVFSRVAMNRDISDEVIIVTEYDPLSAAGVERLKTVMGDELVYLRTWVLLNKMLPEFAETFSDFPEVSRFLSPIPWDAEVVRAYSHRKLPLDLEYGNEFTLALMQTLKGLLGGEMSSQIEKWAESRASIIRQPINEQYNDAEKEVKGLLAIKIMTERKEETKRVLFRFVPLVVAATTLITIFLALFPSRFVEIFESAPIKWVPLLVSLTIVALLISLAMYRFRNFGRTAEKELEIARFNRQLRILEDKLKRLEILRKADLRTLVKERKSY